MTIKCQKNISDFVNSEKIGVCHFLIADGKICGTELTPHFCKDGTNDYWFCPKCDGELKDSEEPPNLKLKKHKRKEE